MRAPLTGPHQDSYLARDARARREAREADATAWVTRRLKGTLDLGLTRGSGRVRSPRRRDALDSKKPPEDAARRTDAATEPGGRRVSESLLYLDLKAFASGMLMDVQRMKFHVWTDLGPPAPGRPLSSQRPLDSSNPLAPSQASLPFHRRTDPSRGASAPLDEGPSSGRSGSSVPVYDWGFQVGPQSRVRFVLSTGKTRDPLEDLP